MAKMISACSDPMVTAASDLPNKMVRGPWGEARKVRSIPLSRSR